MRQKILTLTLLALGAFSTSYAGGLMTNTNYHIAFDRMMARGASMEIDAAYSNPAGLAWGYDGFQLSLNFQKPWQNRDIETTIPSFLKVPGLFDGYDGFQQTSSKEKHLHQSFRLCSQVTRKTVGLCQP